MTPASIAPSSIAPSSAPLSSLLSSAKPSDTRDEATLRKHFDAAVAGTFYRQMLQSLRKLHDKPAYFHGGQAEDMFRNQIDEQVADDLAARHGRAFTDPLFESFASRLR